MEYNYELADETERDLDEVVSEIQELLSTFFNYLNVKKNSSPLKNYIKKFNLKTKRREDDGISYIKKQNILYDHGILNLLEMIIELIEFKIFKTLKSYKTEKDLDDEIVKKRPITYKQLKNLDWDKIESLPQLVARKRLESTFLKIIELLFLSVSKNEKCSLKLAPNHLFYRQMINFYPEYFTVILEEIISNISYMPNDQIDIFKPWLDSIDELSSKAGNIHLQKFFLNILSALMIHGDKTKSVRLFQSKILGGLNKLNQYKSGVIKFLCPSNGDFEDLELEIGDENDSDLQVIFCLSNTSSQTNFKENNPNFVQNIENTLGNEFILYLRDISTNAWEIREYIDYISAYIRMLISLCKDNHQEAIEKCTGDSLGLSYAFCSRAIINKLIDPSIRAAVLEFFKEVFINKFPLKRTTRFRNKCYEYDNIGKRTLTESDINWLNADIAYQSKYKDIFSVSNIRSVNFILKSLIENVFEQLPKEFAQK